MDSTHNEGFKLSSKIEPNDISLFKKIDYLGNFKIDNHDCYKILCITNNGYTIAKYIDKSDGIVRAELTVVNDVNNGPTKTWTTFENHHNQLYFPNKIKTEITKQTPFAIGTSIINIDFNYIVDAPVDEHLFRLPNELSVK